MMSDAVHDLVMLVIEHRMNAGHSAGLTQRDSGRCPMMISRAPQNPRPSRPSPGFDLVSGLRLYKALPEL